MSEQYSATALPWLPRAPETVRDEIRELSNNAAWRQAAHRLVGYFLDGQRLHSVGASINKRLANDPEAVRLGVLSNSTTEFFLPGLVVSALRHGVWMHVLGTAYDQVAAQALDSQSEINRVRCHFVLLSLDHRGLQLSRAVGQAERAHAVVDASLAYTESLRNALRAASGCTVIVQTIPQVATSSFGSRERQIPGTLQWLIDRYNQKLRERIADSADLLLDAAALAEIVGLSVWHDPVQRLSWKLAFGQTVVPLYCEWVARLVAAARGRSRKCLVLDLDNTLWGGVVGDDGVAGLVLGNGSPVGEAFLKVQQTAIELRERGIVLAVSSKNDEAAAREPFQRHPEMLLKEEHIAVFRANWSAKDGNLQRIAQELNIGVEALVLLDDNPAERAQVRAALPQVAVPELPNDPALYPEVLLAAGYFESIAFTEEDRARAAQYQANAVRAQLQESAGSFDDYLRSLEMRAIIGPFDTTSRERITQLINKTNQFNLTVKRYTMSEVAAFEVSSSALTTHIRLIDRFGDNGIIAVLICLQEGQNWMIDTWVMSCRVLNRRIEQTALNYLVARAKEAGIRSLIGLHIRAERNGMVSELYQQLGFAPMHTDNGRSSWRLDVSHYVPVETPVEIIRKA